MLKYMDQGQVVRVANHANCVESTYRKRTGRTEGVVRLSEVSVDDLLEYAKSDEYLKLKEILSGLDVNQFAELKALMWIGSGNKTCSSISDWVSCVKSALPKAVDGEQVSYLMGKKNLGASLRQGLDMLKAL